MRDQEVRVSDRRPSRLALGALGAVGATAAVALGAAWLMREQLAGWALDRYFADREVAATFEIDTVGFDGITLQALDLGEGTQAQTAQAILRWTGGAPRLEAIVLRGIRAQGRWDENGLSLGVLDRLRPAPTGEPLAIPAIGVTIADAIFSLETPMGLAQARLDLNGRMRGALGGELRLSLDRAEGEDFAQTLALSGDEAALTLTFEPQMAGSGPALSGAVRAPWSLTGIVADITATTGSFEGFGVSAQGVSVRARIDGDVPAVGLGGGSAAPFAMVEATATAQSLAFGSVQVSDASLAAISPVSSQGGAAPFTLTVDSFTGPGVHGRAGDIRGVAHWTAEGGLDVSGDLALQRLSLDRSARRAVETAWVEASGTPVEPLSLAGRQAVLGAFDGAALTAPFSFNRTTDVATFQFPGAVELQGGNGVRVQFAPEQASVTLPSGAFSLAGGLRFGAAEIFGVRAEGTFGGAFNAQGLLRAARWTAGGAQLSHGAMALELAGDGRSTQASLSGAATVSGPIAGGRVEDLSIPLRLEVRQGPGGVSLRQAGGCMPLRFAALTLPSVSFANGALGFCPENGLLASISGGGALSGAFTVEGLALAGAQGAAPAQMSAARIEGRWGGDTRAPTLSLDVAEPGYTAALEPERPVGATAARVTALVNFNGPDGFQITGGFFGAQLHDPLSPVRVEDGAGRWAAVPNDDGLGFGIARASALVSDIAPLGTPDATFTPRFNPVRIDGLDATLVGASLGAVGEVRTGASGALLGRLSVQHDVALNVGTASLTIRNLQFGPALQPLDLTEFARGAVISMDGSVSGTILARWGAGSFASNAMIDYDIAQMAIAAVPDIRAVRGALAFDDLLTFSTPPGQTVTIGVLNPGVALRDGAVRFQLLPGGTVAVEDARWQFAAGELTLDPTEIPLNGGEAPLMLRLTEVEAQEAIDALGIQDLTIEGRVEGLFPVMLSASAAVIADGQLRAVAPGRLAYTGPVGQGMTSFADLAFDALSDFQYDDLAVVLNGDLAGDVDIDVRLSGLHAQEDMDLSTLLPLPGGTRATADDVPFRFNIAIHAPFRQLVDTGAGIADARRVVRRTQQPPATAPQTPPLDPPAPRSP